MAARLQGCSCHNSCWPTPVHHHLPQAWWGAGSGEEDLEGQRVLSTTITQPTQTASALTTTKTALANVTSNLDWIIFA